ncbi:4-(cytidine 5'-diphospho)-2-C-methyl-D-erythritol kinase [Gordonia sp. PP30]|uniref:4-(cytidine 5'-diphospho)-2-C-methyl-D-erythritol kinase n=1 Tax=Gordonia sp. PP30 TaxID=2935861 RepID=UPI001FFFBBC9|nr:4-(cytidine 5'-diphospho)-2-C-methyl-D-erythritol kinase [Gordonia sp. PP30]UQE75899.1 4-(cytidine 5'-diphospho)-2-C-methyl-D-erythritol kinase [Gordonia sp. PP30]
MMGGATARVPAKINLHLGVGPLREDGYHELNTVFCALSLYDDVTVRAADEFSVTVRGEGQHDVPSDATNLAARAVAAIAEYAQVPDPQVAIEIEKQIPVAGGMAGGSADAAGALLAAARLWRLDLDREELHDLAASLGSDVPFSLLGGAALGTNRGEELLPVLHRGELHWVIVAAKGGLSTPAVYHELDRLRAGRGETVPPPERPDELIVALASGDVHAVAPLLHNDLQPAALSLQPRLRRTLRAGGEAGALAGIVSGSGPTCVFLCDGEDAAISVATELSGLGVAKAVRTAHGPVPGARLIPAH